MKHSAVLPILKAAVATFGLGAANAAPHCVDKFSNEVAMSKCEDTNSGASDFHLVDGPDPVGTGNDIPATTPAPNPKLVSAGFGKRGDNSLLAPKRENMNTKTHLLNM
ncbi:unnamed protein product [Clonostachys byssicola]|uniref:Intersectin-EH binding protein Ibp1 n=1 Tax=Clonostachys byssicola TaxID=160290 RepID=A0A9N9U6A2_9HYPO|nr:unnamed protein product [Clonostachys byssicola]